MVVDKPTTPPSHHNRRSDSDDEEHRHRQLHQTLEQLEARAALFYREAEADPSVLEDLWALTHTFARTLRLHMKHEEEEVFPSTASGLTASARVCLERILEQHRLLEDSVARLLNYVERARSGQATASTRESIYLVAQHLKLNFYRHSDEEHRYFQHLSAPPRT